MSLQSGMLCAGCNEILNNRDSIFGTSCGHLYHFDCLRNCHAASMNCSHCSAYKPCIFKMFLEFGDIAIPWEEQLKTIALNNELEETKRTIAELEEKYKSAQCTVQKYEGILKKQKDALAGRDITVSELEEKLETFERLNKFLQKDLESVSKDLNNCRMVASVETQNMTSRNMTNLEIPNTEPLKESAKYQCMTNNGNFKNNTLESNMVVSVQENGLQIKSQQLEERAFLNKNNAVQINEETVAGTKKMVIGNYPVYNLKKFAPRDTVLFLASKLGMTKSYSKVNVVVRKEGETVSFIVEADNKYINDFIKRKESLKKFNQTKYLEIKEYTEK